MTRDRVPQPDIGKDPAQGHQRVPGHGTAPGNNFHGQKKETGAATAPVLLPQLPVRGCLASASPHTNSHPGVKASSLLNHRRVLQAIATRGTNFPRFLYLLVFENELTGAENGECQL